MEEVMANFPKTLRPKITAVLFFGIPFIPFTSVSFFSFLSY